MSRTAARAAPTPSGLRGVLRSWLSAWSSSLTPLPLEQPIEPQRPHQQPCGSVHVLVVDDNPVNLIVMSALMASKGLVPVLAADGAEAVEFAGATRFDLIVMDLQMPILDGLKATAAIRCIEETLSRPAVPVIAYSLAAPDDLVLADHGMSGSLDKPCDDRTLEACLVRWCPGYVPQPIVRGGPDVNGHWQAASRDHGLGRLPSIRAR